VSSHAHGRNSTDGRVPSLKFLSRSSRLNYTTWECKYHVVFIPKCRRKTLYLELRRHLGEVFRKLAEQKESKIEEGHLMPDHVHMLISIPPKYAVSQVVGFIKGKSAIPLARVYGERKRNFVGQHFLGERPLRQHGGARRAGDTDLHPQPGEGRSE
jgi:putative transposase